MNIYFSCNGIGLGHVGRSLTMANEFKKKGHNVIFGTWGPAAEYARKERFTCYSLPAIEWVDNPDGSLSLFKTFLNLPRIIYKILKAITFERRILKKEKIAFVFSDMGVGHIAAKMGGIKSCCMTHQLRLSNKNRFFSFCFEKTMYFIISFADKFLVNDFKNPDNIFPYSNSRYSKAIYIGPLVRKRPHNYPSKDVLKRKLKIKEKLCVILITGPKKSPLALEKRIFALEEKLLRMKDWEFIIRSWSNRKSKGNIIYITWIEDMHEVIKSADVIVSRAGYSTVCDILCFGKKSILIPQPKQMEQEALAEYLQWMGVAYNISQKETEKIPQLLEKIDADKTMGKKLGKYKSLFLKTNLTEIAEKIITIK